VAEEILAEDFESWPLEGWSIVNNGGDCVWRAGSDEFGPDPNLTGGSGDYADADSDACGSGTTMDTELWTPYLDLSEVMDPWVEFKSDMNHYYAGGNEYWEVDVSGDGGATWTNLLHRDGGDYPGPETITLSLAAVEGSTAAVVRFHYGGAAYDFWWQVDEVRVYGCVIEPTLTPVPTLTLTPTVSPIPTSTPIPPTATISPTFTPPLTVTPQPPTVTPTPSPTATRVPPTSTPPRPTSTPAPSSTPTPEKSPTPVFPTKTPAPPSPTAVPASPTAAPSPTPEPWLGVRLWMPADYFRPGTPCELVAKVGSNFNVVIENVPFVVMLDIGTGDYWFWPSWKKWPWDYDYVLIRLEPGVAVYQIVEPFTWPDSVEGELSDVRFYGAILDQAWTQVVGELGMWRFGYGK
jgi:hypothetical protein